MKRFYPELTFWIFLAVAVTLFVKAMNGLLPVFFGHLPVPDGLKQVLAK